MRPWHTRPHAGPREPRLTRLPGVPREPRPHGRAHRRPPAAHGRGAGGWRGRGGKAPPRPGQAARSRPHRAPSGFRHALPRDRRPGRPRHVRRGCALRGARHRHRPREGTRGHGGGERRHREGRHLLPAHGQEAPAGPGDRPGEPAALRLPRGLGWGLPASPGRGLPRPRPFRPHLLQRSADERPGHPPDQRGPRLVHGRGSLRPRDERRSGDREGPRDHLPGRSAPREGGHRRGGHRRRAGRGRRPLPHERRGRPLRAG